MKSLIFNLLNAAGRRLSGKGLGLERLTGLKRAYESTYRKVAPSDVTMVEVQGNRMYINPRDEPLGRSLATQGIYEAYETQLFRALVQPGMTVVDIGANVGYYTLMAAQLVGEVGRVYAFEPDPKNFELLSRNLELNGYRNVVAVQKAVSNISGNVTLYIDRTNFGNRSFGEKNIVNDGGSVEAATISLDEFCDSQMRGLRIDVLKIDAQGAEGLIFEGARKTLTKQTPQIFMEFEPDMLLNLGTKPVDLLRQFANIGYTIKLIDYLDKMLRPVRDEDLLEACKESGYVDLFLERDPNLLESSG